MIDGNAVARIGEYAQEAQDAETRVVEVHGVPFSTTQMYDLRKKDPQPDALVVSSLSGFCDYIEANRDDLSLEGMLIHVVSPTQVDLVSPIRGQFHQRATYVSARADSPVTAGHLGFRFGAYLDQETMNIAVQALFADSEDRADVLKILKTIKSEATITTADDGVTQKVEAKAGIHLVTQKEVPNPVLLAPYRTFVEIAQPVSPFVLRLKASGETVHAALFEADGGAWERTAVDSIAYYLKDALGDSNKQPAIVA